MYETPKIQIDDALGQKSGIVEIATVAVVLLVTWLLTVLPGQWQVVLYLFFLPVSFSGFYLGRYRSGVIALLSVTGTLVVIVADGELRGLLTPANCLALCVWGAVLGLTAILTGTVSDERKRHSHQLNEMHRQDTLKDALTEVANRRAFDYELERRIAERERQGTCFSLLMIDIDHFKRLNDTYGHQAGDAVIRGVAQILDELTREMDLVARYGGEEFAAVLPSSNASEAKDAAERVRRKIELNRFVFRKTPLRITVSVGAAQALKDESGELLVTRVDQALYASKQSGRNCSHFHTGEGCEPFGDSDSRIAVQSSQSLVVDSSPANDYWDPETNLPNRRILVDDLRRRVSEARRFDLDLSIAMIEIGDTPDSPGPTRETIRLVTELIRAALRDSDMVARYSLNELAVMMPSTALPGAAKTANRIRESIEQCQTVHHGSASCPRVKIGVAVLRSSEDAVALLERAQAGTETLEDAAVNSNSDEFRAIGKPSGIDVAECVST